MRRWLDQTHDTGFELFRHFLVRFFDSDLVTTPGQWTKVLIGAFSLLVPVFMMVVPSLGHKYAYFSSLPSPEPYRHALRADELWLITLSMSAVGLLAAVEWQSLFPGLRDYLALGALPVRPRQIFLAKLLALFALISAAIAVVNAFPTLAFAALSQGGRWQSNPSFLAHFVAHGATCVLASYFLCFALIACQGFLLNLLPPRLFARVTSYAQGLLITLMLVLIVLSMSIDSKVEMAVLRPEMAKWLPPVWFLGLYQAILGDPDPQFRALAARALAGLAAAIGAALLFYLVSYQRHRRLFVEGAAGRQRDSKLGRILLDWAIPNPRQQAVFVFMARTLARSAQHRMVLMGYLGFSLAMVLSGIIGLRETARMPRALEPSQVVMAGFVNAHLVLLIGLLIGFRHLFSIPSELRANWIFRITEREGRTHWLRAIDRFALFSVAPAILLLPLPLEVAMLGARAVGESIVFAVGGLLVYERLFFEAEKLPFTCSYLPGKRPAWVIVLAFIGIVSLLPVANLMLVSLLASRVSSLLFLALLVVTWTWIHRLRELSWAELPLMYEEAPEPAVRTLNLSAR
jgi:hypothetical protein